jgi:TonB family protein
MKRSLQFKRPGGGWCPTAWALVGLLGMSSPVWAQSSPTLTDAERAKRDANKVFSFIKFHAVKPAAARPAPTPSVATAPATAPAPRPATARSEPSSAPAIAAAPTPAASSAPASPVAAADSTLAVTDPRSLPPESPPEPVASAASGPAPESPPASEEEDDDPGIKLVKYVAPELNARAMAAMPGNSAKVRVRFTVMPDGSSAKVTAVSNAPRALAQVATRAVEQWRFEGVKEPQVVEVEVDFRVDQ